MADQAASVFGLQCWKKGDVKLTLGTGSFLDVNTSDQPHASIEGLYPLVGWSNDTSIKYLVEGSSYDTGTLIEWGVSIGLYDTVSESSNLALSVEDSGGVVFCPGFGGLQAPINDSTATAGFLGVKPDTRKGHLVRALLESVAFRVKQLYEVVLSETKYEFHTIRVDGGVSQNDFICQLISDLCGLTVRRSSNFESSLQGVFYMLKNLQSPVKDNSIKSNSIQGDVKDDIIEFIPRSSNNYENVYKKWVANLKRFQNWYED